MNNQPTIQGEKGNEDLPHVTRKWIKVAEQLPLGKPVLICYENYMIAGNMAVAYYHDGNWVLFHSSTNDDPIKPPTYWMELPNMPTFG